MAQQLAVDKQITKQKCCAIVLFFLEENLVGADWVKFRYSHMQALSFLLNIPCNNRIFLCTYKS